MDNSCTSKYFLTNQIEKNNNKFKIINEMLMILDLKILSHYDIIPLHVKIINF